MAAGDLSFGAGPRAFFRRGRKCSTWGRRPATPDSRHRRCRPGSISAARLTACPTSNTQGFKIASDRHGPPFNPDTGERIVSAAAVAGTFAAIWPTAFRHWRVSRSWRAKCATVRDTVEWRFPDRSPSRSRPNVWLVGGGSDHGFKHGPVCRAVTWRSTSSAAPRPKPCSRSPRRRPSLARSIFRRVRRVAAGASMAPSQRYRRIRSARSSRPGAGGAPRAAESSRPAGRTRC